MSAGMATVSMVTAYVFVDGILGDSFFTGTNPLGMGPSGKAHLSLSARAAFLLAFSSEPTVMEYAEFAHCQGSLCCRDFAPQFA
jgi:hypothetical protein